MAVVEFGVDALWCLVGASFVHENSEKDRLAIDRAVGTDEEFHLASLAIVHVVVVVAILLTIASILVSIVVCGIFINFETTAFKRFLDVKLVLSIVVLLVLLAVVESG